MSKSKNNGVDPQSLVDRFGADTVRLYTMFTSPPEQSLEWSDDGVEGANRFLKRLWALAYKKHSIITSTDGTFGDLNAEQKTARLEIHTTLKQACFDYDRQQFNTVVSAAMKIVNTLYKLGDEPNDAALLHEGMSIVLRLLGPIAPHMTHELWRTLGLGDEILNSTWPQADESALIQDSIQYVIQVNGKVRAKIEVPADADKAAIEQAAQNDPNAQKFIGDAQIRKIIVVPNKLVNIVAK